MRFLFFCQLALVGFHTLTLASPFRLPGLAHHHRFVRRAKSGHIISTAVDQFASDDGGGPTSTFRSLPTSLDQNNVFAIFISTNPSGTNEPSPTMASSTSTAPTAIPIASGFSGLFDTRNRLFPVTIVVTIVAAFLATLIVIAGLQWIAHRDCFTEPEEETMVLPYEPPKPDADTRAKYKSQLDHSVREMSSKRPPPIITAPPPRQTKRRFDQLPLHQRSYPII